MKLYPWVESMFIFIINISFAAVMFLGVASFFILSVMGARQIVKNDKEHEQREESNTK